MRPFLLLIILLFITTRMVVAQDAADSFLHITHLPPGGIVLDTSWKYTASDDPAYAAPNYDDKSWPTLNLNQPPQQLLKATKRGRGWLRLHFSLDPSLRHLPMALLITQYGASEVYMDGQLLQKYGSFSARRITPFNPHGEPVPLQLDTSSLHLLAIHFAIEAPSSSRLIKRVYTAPLLIKLAPASVALKNRQTAINKLWIVIGNVAIGGVFGLLFLLVFLIYPRQPLNLFFSSFTICLALSNGIRLFLLTGQYGLSGVEVLSLLIQFFERSIGASIMAFVAMALYGKILSFIKGLIIYTLTIDFIGVYFFPPFYAYISHISHLLFMGSFLWLSVRAFRNINLKNWFMGILAFVAFMVNLNFFLHLLWGFDTSYFDNVTPLILLPAMVIYLAIDFAQTNVSLEWQLVQVKNLSQEKQQLLSEQKATLERQVKERTAALNHSLEELKSTQAQLIQREKMASLGELTAGIAHEIQNPLNFVNNFSEVNKELITELKEEIDKGRMEEAKAIANDIEENEQKINHHGKRADSIVKGMLQHSRQSTGQKELTDINALAEEYLRLSYQSIRSKDKSFNATIITDFDKSISKVPIIPQDIGRVLLNLFNNAFYAVNEKKNPLNGTFEPTVFINTKKYNNHIEVIIKDNGIGIPQKVLNKIFQPFFTTKPTGEGTGLGLSLSYDIIKAHGGELSMESKEGEGSIFYITLPEEKSDL